MSKHIETLVTGLKKAQKIPRQWSEIAEESGVSKSTIVQIAAGRRPNVTTCTFERIYCALVRRGHLENTFVYESVA